jgi:hypothetical protein
MGNLFFLIVSRYVKHQGDAIASLLRICLRHNHWYQ